MIIWFHLLRKTTTRKLGIKINAQIPCVHAQSCSIQALARILEWCIKDGSLGKKDGGHFLVCRTILKLYCTEL